MWCRLLPIILVTVASPVVYAQDLGPQRCPVITVRCPSDVDVGTPLKCSASAAEADRSKKLSFKWTVSAGVIIKGQNTDVIVVDTAHTFPATIEAKVEIGGIRPSTCPNTASGYSTVLISDLHIINSRDDEVSSDSR